MGKGGLSFLNKKSWHTATIRNAEKVWLAEQKNAAEETKLKQLRKEIEDERQVEHLRNLQRQHGVGSVQATERLDWMYRNVAAELDEKEKEKEEYLLGKKVDTATPSVPSPSKPTNEEPEMARWVRKYENRHLDAESRIREDPMLVIMQRERDIRMNVVKNPLQMKRIREEVKLVKKLKKLEKSEKKLKRKEEKKRLRKLQKLGLSADSELPDDKHRKDRPEPSEDRVEVRPADSRDRYGLLHPRKVTKEPSLDRVDACNDRRQKRSRQAPSKSRSRSRSRSRDRSRRSRRRHRRHSLSPSPSRSSSRSRSAGRGYWRRSRHDSRSRSSSRHNRRSLSTSRSPRRRNHSSSGVRRDRRPAYRRSPSRSPQRRAAGTRRGAAPTARRRAHPRPLKPHRHVASSSCSNLTAEQRAAKLAAMMQDADAQHNLRKQQLEKDMVKQAQEEAALREMEAGDAAKTAFISDMNKSAFMDSKDNLEDRISQRKHYRQKGNTDEHSFM